MQKNPCAGLEEVGFTLTDTTNFQVVQSCIYKQGKVLVASITLRTNAAISSGERTIGTLDDNFPSLGRWTSVVRKNSDTSQLGVAVLTGSNKTIYVNMTASNGTNFSFDFTAITD